MIPVQQTNTCTIARNIITVNGQIVFGQAPDMDFATFAKAAFRNLELAYPKFYKMDGLCKLGFLAVEYLLAGTHSCRPDGDTAIVLSSSSGSIESDLTHLRNAAQPSPAVFVYTLPNIVAGEIAIRLGIRGETAFFICEHDDPTPQQYAAGLMAGGMAKSCISGWIDYTEERYLANINYFSY